MQALIEKAKKSVLGFDKEDFTALVHQHECVFIGLDLNKFEIAVYVVLSVPYERERNDALVLLTFKSGINNRCIEKKLAQLTPDFIEKAMIENKDIVEKFVANKV